MASSSGVDMGVVAGIGAAAAAASLASSVSSLSSGGPSGGANGTYGGSNPGTYIPQGQGQADAYYQDILNNFNTYSSGVPAQFVPEYQAYGQNIISNPFAAQALTGSYNASQYGTNTLAPQQQAGATSLYNLGNSITAQSLDPQNALYNQTAQNVLGQSAVANAQSGVQGPAAAGVTDNNLNNFNLNWQNNQLSREAQGAQAAGQAYAGGSALGTAGLSDLASSSALLQNTYNQQQQSILGGLNDQIGGINTAFGPDQSIASLLQSYLGLGQSATNLAQVGQQAGFNQNQQVGSNIGSALSSLGNNQALSNPNSGFNNFLSNNFGSGTGGYDTTGGGLFGYGETGMTYAQLLGE